MLRSLILNRHGPLAMPNHARNHVIHLSMVGLSPAAPSRLLSEVDLDSFTENTPTAREHWSQVRTRHCEITSRILAFLFHYSSSRNRRNLSSVFRRHASQGMTECYVHQETLFVLSFLIIYVSVAGE